MTWTAAQTERLRSLWLEGLSGSQIGAQLGMSRNAVIGRAHRLKLAARAPSNDKAEARLNDVWGRVAPQTARPKIARPKVARPKAERPNRIAPDLPAEPMPVVPSNLLTVLDPIPETAVLHHESRSNQCLWPLWPSAKPVRDVAPEDRLVCGALLAGAAPYCRAHMARAYSPARVALREGVGR
ncbi:hypothetical protein C3941_23685 [Kaistia algarum]|uniref:GcrA family cell cycle regulator n=1 Tax=Kaistia algarum TaxID=2083279 RepID=UPI000CE880BB|nr:GcrA family cell cycle regulator [Kaistia algarum]MCX5513438.1 hypothetical protein [Kaistia algarum]PPE77462.1 hypothetical protein C3941_23685 [Kaistia algarum]